MLTAIKTADYFFFIMKTECNNRNNKGYLQYEVWTSVLPVKHVSLINLCESIVPELCAIRMLLTQSTDVDSLET